MSVNLRDDTTNSPTFYYLRNLRLAMKARVPSRVIPFALQISAVLKEIQG